MASSSSFLEYQIDFKDTAKWTSYLATQGFVVVTNVMSLPTTKEAVSSFLSDFGADNHVGFMDHRSFPYSRCAWMCRAHPQVLSVYQTLYGLTSPEELLTAIDRGSALSNVVNEDATEPWLHVDYPLEHGGIFVNNREPVLVYQSFLSLVEPGNGSSPFPGLRVVPMSDDELQREHHPRILAAGEGETTFWCLSQAHRNELKSRMVPVVSPAGSLTLWKCGLIHENSRTVHCPSATEPLARFTCVTCQSIGPLRRRLQNGKKRTVCSILPRTGR